MPGPEPAGATEGPGAPQSLRAECDRIAPIYADQDKILRRLLRWPVCRTMKLFVPVLTVIQHNRKLRGRSQVHSPRSRVLLHVFGAAALMLGIAGVSGLPAHASEQASSGYTPAKVGELDCNGFSSVQKEVRPSLCTDISGAIK